MDLISAWNEVLNGGKITAKDILPNLVDMLTSRASAYHAIESRRKEREKRLKRNCKSYYLGHELYWQVAEYYSNNYENGQLRQHPLDEDTQAWHEHDKTRQNKQKYYYKCRYEEVLNIAKSVLSKQGGQPSDDKIIEYLFKQMPDNAFSKEELDIWKKIYEFANTKTEYIAVKRSNRRKQEPKNCTYLEFAAWLTKNSGEYSSKDSYFVARMVKYYNNTISAKKVDNLLRYNASKEFFSEGDLTALGLTTQAVIDKFFKAIDTINKARKKK